MRRLVALLVLLTGLSVPALAIAGVFPPDTESQGRIEGDPNTWFGYDVVKAGKVHKVKHISAIVPMHCYNGDDPTIEVSVPGSFKIRTYHLPPHVHVIPPRFFYADAEIETDAGPGDVDLYGDLRSHHRGRGEIEVETEDETMGACYSGYLSWKVSGEDVPPPPP
jgi:hypothetical protein